MHRAECVVLSWTRASVGRQQPRTARHPTPAAGKAVDRGAVALAPPSYGISSIDRAGVPLSREDRDWYEGHLGVSFARVRIHDGPAAAQMTGRHGAAAATYGDDIYLSPQAPRRGTERGERMLAHELVHVAQFQRGAGAGGARTEVASLEREASSVAATLSRSGSARVVGQATASTAPLRETPSEAAARDPAPLGIRLTGWRYTHMAAVGKAIYYEIELALPVDYTMLRSLLFEGGQVPMYGTVMPWPKGTPTPTRNWIIGGPQFWSPVLGGRTFFSSIKEPYAAELERQFMKLDRPPTQPAWLSQQTVDAVGKYKGPPPGADIKLTPGAGPAIYVWREGDIWYWYDAAPGELQAFWADPSKTSFGEKMYTNWVVQRILTGMSPQASMDLTVKDMAETNVAILGAFAMTLASARPMSRPPPIGGSPLRIRVPDEPVPPTRPAGPRLVSSQRSIPPPVAVPHEVPFSQPVVRGNTAVARAPQITVPTPVVRPQLRAVPDVAPAVPAPAPVITPGSARLTVPTIQSQTVVPPLPSPVRLPVPRPESDADKGRDEEEKRKNPIVTLWLPLEKAPHLLLYAQHLHLLQHKIKRWGDSGRKTTQRDRWDASIDPTRGGEMTMENLCWGLALRDRRPGGRGNLNLRAVLRPTWDQSHFRSDMDVDHKIEMQVAPIGREEMYDQAWNYELLDDTTNSDAGRKLDANMELEREDLFARTGDIGWRTREILRFHRIVIVGTTTHVPGRWDRASVIEAAHLHVYQTLTGESADPADIRRCVEWHGRPR